MNILADIQRKLSDVGLSNEEEKQQKQLFNELYYKLRQTDENSFLGKLSLKTRKRLHKILLFIFKVKIILNGFKYKVINDKSKSTSRPIIFALTHIGKYDIEVTAVAIKEHFYLLSGDYEHLQGTLDGSCLLANGVLYFNEKNKQERSNIINRMIDILLLGANLMYFPEGTWNLHPALPVLPCFWGIVEVAQKSNAIIIPVAVEQYKNKFKINIGENFDVQQYYSDVKGKSNAIIFLRDMLATLKWGIWETEPQLQNNETIYKEWNKYINDRFEEWPYFDMDYISTMIYKPKNIVCNADVFAHLDNMCPTKQNAFLFNKRLKGYLK